jgi:hypothetical protein
MTHNSKIAAIDALNKENKLEEYLLRVLQCRQYVKINCS